MWTRLNNWLDRDETIRLDMVLFVFIGLLHIALWDFETFRRVTQVLWYILLFRVFLHKSKKKKSGSWIVYSWDTSAYPISIFKHEIDALRYCENLGYGHVRFWAHGTEWSSK